LRIEVKGEDMNGKEYTKTLMLKVGDEASGVERLTGIDFDQEILNVQVPSDRPTMELMYIPALLLYGLIWFVQNNRKKKQRKAPVPA
jgi:hypothetical protein